MTIRLGLCCIFRGQPIKFRTTTAAAISRMSRQDRLKKISTLCLANADALAAALAYCDQQKIGCFRIISQILPLKTHPQHGYEVKDLPDNEEIKRRFQECGSFAHKHGLRTCFHPDQFVVLNSLRPDVVDASINELEYQAEVAAWVGADVLNIHAGGAFGDKQRALESLLRSLNRLSVAARSRLTIENDDVLFTPSDLLPLCQAEGVPLVYDVHHHRCNRDGLSEQVATDLAMNTWDREPLFHISSPLEGWDGPAPRRHHDFIAIEDFPGCWVEKPITVEVEAKAKELAVMKLMQQLQRQRRHS
jgi:UV DNA damage endonuclease